MTVGAPATIVLGLVGVLALVLFVVIERRVANPMVPLAMFRSRQFSGANATTLLVYAALSGVLFLLVVHLQTDLGYSALEAGAAFLPATACMLVLSPRTGALSQRIGPRIPMTVGPLIAGSGMALLARVEPGRSYWTAVLPGVLVLGLGLSITVAPLTTAVLAAAGDAHAGIGSAINNAVSRVAGLVAIAILPTAAGLTTNGNSLDLVARVRHGDGHLRCDVRARWSRRRRAHPHRNADARAASRRCHDPVPESLPLGVDGRRRVISVPSATRARARR